MAGYYPQRPPGQQQSSRYWRTPGYTIPGAASYQPQAAKKGPSKGALYVVAIVLLLAGVFLIYRGFSSSPSKISLRLEGLGEKDAAVVGIVCSPCGAAQEGSLEAVVGRDNFKGTTRTQMGSEIMIAKATGDQLGTLATKDWVKYIDRVE